MNNFITIVENCSAEITEKKSKFIANLYYVESVREAEKIIKDCKKKYFDARHNCVAYRIVENDTIVEKSSDDGEPSGTAGGPMLNILQKENLANVLVIVTRYFGGILLGTGGLVRSYSECTKNAIESSKKIEKCKGCRLEVTLDYNYFENFKYYCKNNNISIVNSEYSENIVCNIELEESKKQKIFDDFETKSINLKDIKFLCTKFVPRSI